MDIWKKAHTYLLLGLRIDSLYRQWLKFTMTIKRPKQNKATTWLLFLLSSIKDLNHLHIMPAFSENKALYNSYAIWKDNLGFLCFKYSMTHELAGISRKGNLLRRVMSWIFFKFYLNRSSNDNYETKEIKPVMSKNEKRICCCSCNP